MNSALDRVALKLESELGANSVCCDSGASSGYGTASLVCAPETAEQLRAVLRLCAEAKAAVRPRGGDTAANVGNAPREAFVTVDLRRLQAVLEHDHANLTVTAQSGITLAALKENLAAQQQFLPFDAPHAGIATLGGTIALSMNGPRRGFYGAVRDLVIGMKVALITGEQIKAGGKVVKNVAGYDMCKLFTGSLGTLGIITEATVRVAPVPETAATIIISGTFESVMEFANWLAESQLLPAAVVLMNAPQPGRWQVAAWCEGLTEHVVRHTRDAELMAQRLGVTAETLQDRAHRELWHRVCDFPLETGHCVHRVTLPRSAVAPYLHALPTLGAPMPEVVSDLVIGTVWLSWPANDYSVSLLPRLISDAQARRGHAILFAAPARLKEAIDVWGPPPASHPLMRKIKQQFDPDGLLNPGRFLSGI
jgi:glycolate oxidase FAD binding subunit